jgi:hypothetical protein
MQAQIGLSMLSAKTTTFPSFDGNNHSRDQIQNNKNMVKFENFDMV